MAKEYDNTNRGSIWQNKDKNESNPNAPDFKGEMNVQGLEFWVAAWKRKPDANPKAPALSFSIQSKDQRQDAMPQRQSQKPNEQKPASSSFDEFSDDIPFANPYKGRACYVV